MPYIFSLEENWKVFFKDPRVLVPLPLFAPSNLLHQVLSWLAGAAQGPTLWTKVFEFDQGAESASYGQPFGCYAFYFK